MQQGAPSWGASGWGGGEAWHQQQAYASAWQGQQQPYYAAQQQQYWPGYGGATGGQQQGWSQNSSGGGVAIHSQQPVPQQSQQREQQHPVMQYYVGGPQSSGPAAWAGQQPTVPSSSQPPLPPEPAPPLPVQPAQEQPPLPQQAPDQPPLPAEPPPATESGNHHHQPHQYPQQPGYQPPVGQYGAWPSHHYHAGYGYNSPHYMQHHAQQSGYQHAGYPASGSEQQQHQLQGYAGQAGYYGQWPHAQQQQQPAIGLPQGHQQAGDKTAGSSTASQGGPTQPDQQYTASAAGYPQAGAQQRPSGPQQAAGSSQGGAVVAQAVQAAKQSLEALRPVVDVNTILRKPGRFQRAPRILIILRGLPGSGKSHIAKKLKDAEVEEGGDAPRIHSIDDYFITEVEREVEDEGHAAAGGSGRSSTKGRKRTVMEMQYVYDASMESTYQKSLIKAVTRTMEEGRYTLVILDAPNLRVDDFRDAMAAAQRFRYEAYLLQPLESDPALCARRNIHARTLKELVALAQQWEAAPPSIPVLNVKPLLSGQLQGASNIDEVDMDNEEAAGAGAQGQGSSEKGNGPAGRSRDGGTQGAPVAPKVPLSRWLAEVDELDGPGSTSTQGVSASGPKGGLKRGGAGDKGGKRSRWSAASSSDAEILAAVSSDLMGADGRNGKKSKAGGSSSLGLEDLDASELAELYDRARARVKRRVWWPDQGRRGPDGNSSSLTGSQASKPVGQLETVHVLEGLGPAKGDTALVYMDASSPLLSGQAAAMRRASFADRVKAEHVNEHDKLAGHHLSDGGDDGDE